MPIPLALPRRVLKILFHALLTAEVNRFSLYLRRDGFPLGDVNLTGGINDHFIGNSGPGGRRVLIRLLWRGKGEPFDEPVEDVTEDGE